MRKLIVLAIIIAFMFIGFLLYRWLQLLIQPRRSFARLLFYFIAILVSVFILSFLMVLAISRIYPNELMK